MLTQLVKLLQPHDTSRPSLLFVLIVVRHHDYYHLSMLLNIPYSKNEQGIPVRVYWYTKTYGNLTVLGFVR